MRMKKFRPLLLQDTPIRVSGLVFRRLVLNRHIAAEEAVRAHRHRFGQVLLYLHGGGTLRAGPSGQEQVWVVGPGSLIWVPPGARHDFTGAPGRAPLCLVLEFDWQGPKSLTPVVTRLPGERLAAVRQQLSALARRDEPEAEAHRLESAAVILQLCAVVFPALGLLPAVQVRISPLRRQVESLLRQPGGVELRPGEIAQRLGLNATHLSRVLRETGGLTLGALRDQVRLDRAVQALRQGKPVATAGMQAGFFDQNYFARWFRKATGASPSEWQRQNGAQVS
jgi:AraC family transcriptional activator of pobA